eukprot:CAMPEP_0113951316 /NCGR_PEP_ID=MMETSP1339-20121228/85488_1 /TAXON_ID=94617 /ORGANISM="Fibrocapsa japonica" /LENGTH=54 /DNA_ID=CAMNT_0000959521 /DNA_START=119 /DNA_END=283 /DNA_ORIENTATION=+ /assembly_acc=CAM_ASM_000762
MEAAGQGHAQIVSALLEAGADPNMEDTHGQTALAWAQQGGSQEVVNILQPVKTA